PMDQRVVKAMLVYMTEKFGNASSAHAMGHDAADAVEEARHRTANLIGGSHKGVFFTSGATESINLGLLGAARFYRDKGNHIITVRTEHPAVLDACRRLEEEGFEVTYLPVDNYGLLDLKCLSDAITDRTLLISVMYANNEIGTVQDVGSIGEIARSRGVLFHCDASQAALTEPIDVDDMKIDLLSFTGHKMYGPKGVGVLYLGRRRPRVRLDPILFGGGHEQGIRPGTLNVPGIVGMGTACEIVRTERLDVRAHLGHLRQRLYSQFRKRFPEVRLNGHPRNRLPGNLNLTFYGIRAKAMLETVPEVALSTGSACSSAIPKPSHVLNAIGLTPNMAAGTIRFGLGRGNTESELDEIIKLLSERIQEWRRRKEDVAGCTMQDAGQP
ncbi:MAG: cysteine desulfurase family protein, partial [Verrucomicrobiota bacterium]